MNERIKKLAEQAGMTVDSDYSLYTKDFTTYGNFVEKFAQLIVRECIDICLDQHHTWQWDNEPDSSSGPRDCAHSIKKRFGVES